MVYTLTQMSLPCRGFADGAAFRAAVAEATPDLILLDIMLTAKGTEMDKVQGLDYGTDDYSEAKK